MAQKIRYAISPMEEQSFIDEFKGYWKDEQLIELESISASKGGLFNIGSGKLPNPNTVDPKTDPVMAHKILMNPRSSFRLGEKPFVLPVVSYLIAAEKNIPPEIQILKNQYDIYLIKYGIDVKPRENEKFAEVEIRLDYPDNQGIQTYSIIPDTEIEEKLALQNKTNIGLDVNLRFKVPNLSPTPGIEVGGGIHASNETNLIFHWEYKVLAANVIALGEKSSYVEWNIKKPKQMVGSVELSTVLCVPKGLKELPITVDGYYRLERGIWWWKHDTPVTFNSSNPIIAQLSDNT